MSIESLQAHVIVATKGRAEPLNLLLDRLQRQTLQPTSVTVIGVTEDDVRGAAGRPCAGGESAHVLVTQRAGTCLQRNVGIEHVVANASARDQARGYFVVFFDDDFRPADDWLAQCRDVFVAQADVVAVTGRVLADGVGGPGLGEADALAYLVGARPPEPHWAGGTTEREMVSVYGCNMAFRDRVLQTCRFDENLPLYGWQEDQDYTGQARRYGRIVFAPGCRGVHLGSKGGRTSGLRFGYSQIANPLYLIRKGTMDRAKSARFILRHLLSNSVRSIKWNPKVDYRGRLRGNVMAIVDVLRGRCHPSRVLELG